MSEADKIVFSSVRFGEVAVDRTGVLTFPQGLPGFEAFKTYGILEREEEAPFLRLLSVENPRLGFVVIDPTLVWPDYDPDIGPEELGSLGVADGGQVAIYCIVTLSPDPEKVTANLKGPICINTQTMQARQMILVDDRYHTKHPILGARQERP
ncbi:MAG: flagellar assembly protein FliW [Candidatus Latescibacterota bacterium]